MPKLLRLLIPVTLCGLLLLTGQTNAQEEEPAALLYTLVNQVRLGDGLSPYDRSELLDASAQRHAEDLATHDLADPHVGSDGSTAPQRIAEAGYAAWGDGAVTGENVRISHGTVQDSLDWFLGSTPHRNNILSSRYREIGIGIATDADGRHYHVLNFGARPNVLPIFINDEAGTTESRQVAIRLSNEEAYPQGQGAIYMGRAIEVRISNSPDFDNLLWQSWEPLLAWTLPEELGEHTVYVQFRDGAGRTAASADTILLLPGVGTPTAIPATATLTRPPPTSTPTPTETPTPTPLPTETPTIIHPPTAIPTTLPTPTPLRVAVASATPFPTWTPLPVPRARPGGPGPLLGLVCGLETVAVLLGIYLALRRSRLD